MDKKYIPASFSSNFEVNEEFVKCTISVMSEHQIANGTKFTREAINKALPTLNYAPIIGYYKDNDFSDHGIEYKISNDGFEEIVNTIPFGVCIKDSQRFEKVMKDNGEYEEYLVVDCYLWGRYSEAINKVKENKCNQSMEVSVTNGSWQDNYFEVTDFNYSALCILGENVTPAFSLAKIRTSDKFSKDDFKACYSEMTSALDKFLNYEEGEENMAKKRKCSKCETEIEFEDEFDETEDFVCEECAKSEEFSKKEVFELSFDEIREKLRNSIKQKDVYCWIVQTFNDHFIYEEEIYKDNSYDAKFYKQSYQLENDEVKLADDKVEVFTRFLTKEEMDKLEEEKETYSNEIDSLKVQCSDLQGELSKSKESYNELENEVEGLRKFKTDTEFEAHKIEVDEVLSKYSELETVDGYSELVKDKYSCDMCELEKEIKVFAFDNNITLGKKIKKNFSKETVKIPVHNTHNADDNLTEAEKRYGVGINKYLKLK